MQSRLRVLSLEDDPYDAELIRVALEDEGIACEFERMQSEEEFLGGIAAGGWDLILADYTLPSFDGMSALEIARERLPDTPFILVSGTLGEEPAIEALTRGATDYVLKHRLSRLAPAIRRALAEARERAERRRAEEAASALLAENRLLVRKLLAIQEEERRHLAHELHDEIGQSLTAIQAEAEMVRRRSRSSDEEIRASAHTILSVSTNIYGAVHAILERLRPAALDNLGLVDSLRDAINSWQAREPDTVCRLRIRGNLANLGEQVNITIYRAVQECLTNISNHAAAREVVVELAAREPGKEGDTEGRGGCVTLEVRDDGKGIEPDTQRRGFGLIGMRERVEALDGRFDFMGSPGKGVAIRISIPLAAATVDRHDTRAAHRSRTGSAGAQ